MFIFISHPFDSYSFQNGQKLDLDQQHHGQHSQAIQSRHLHLAAVRVSPGLGDHRCGRGAGDLPEGPVTQARLRQTPRVLHQGRNQRASHAGRARKGSRNIHKQVMKVSNRCKTFSFKYVSIGSNMF